MLILMMRFKPYGYLDLYRTDGTLTKEMVSNALLNKELRRDGTCENRSSSSNSDTLVHEYKGRTRNKGSNVMGSLKIGKMMSIIFVVTQVTGSLNAGNTSKNLLLVQ